MYGNAGWAAVQGPAVGLREFPKRRGWRRRPGVRRGLRALTSEPREFADLTASPGLTRTAGDTVGWHAESVELRPDRRVGPRGVGDQHDSAAPLAEPRQCLGRAGKGALPIVQDAPDVAEDDVVTVGDLGQAGQDRGCLGWG